jgi:hypothetical protein
MKLPVACDTRSLSAGVEPVEKVRWQNLQEKRPPHLAYKERSRFGRPVWVRPTFVGTDFFYRLVRLLNHVVNFTTRIEDLEVFVLQQDPDEVRKLIAGPKVQICEDCVDRCIDVLAEELAKKPQGCLLCGLTKEMQEMTRIPGRGTICSSCLDEVRAVMEHLKECDPRQAT